MGPNLASFWLIDSLNPIMRQIPPCRIWVFTIDFWRLAVTGSSTIVYVGFVGWIKLDHNPSIFTWPRCSSRSSTKVTWGLRDPPWSRGWLEFWLKMIVVRWTHRAFELYHSMHGMRHASLSNAFSPVLRLLLSLLVAFPASGLRTISGDEAPGERPEGAVWVRCPKLVCQVLIMFLSCLIKFNIECWSSYTWRRSQANVTWHLVYI